MKWEKKYDINTLVVEVSLIFHCHHSIFFSLFRWLISLSYLCYVHHFSFSFFFMFGFSLVFYFFSIFSLRASQIFYTQSRVVCIQTMSCSFWPFHTVDAIKMSAKGKWVRECVPFWLFFGTRNGSFCLSVF